MKQDQGDASVASDDGCETTDARLVSSEESKDTWILNSGYTFHMTPHEEWLEEFTTSDSGNMLLGDNKSCKIMGMVSVRIRLHSGQVRLIQEVMYVSALKRNLLSIGVSDKEVYVISAKKCVMKVSLGSMIVMRENRINGIYILDGKTITCSVSVADHD